MYGKLAVMLAFAASVVGAGNAAAQASPRVISYQDAIGIALRQGVAVRQAQNAVESQDAAVTRQKLAFLPDLRVSTSLGSSTGRTFSQDEGGIVNTTTNSLNAGLQSSVTLFDGLRNVANLKSAQLGQQASEYDLQRAQQTAVMSVAQNYLALIQAREQLRVRQQALAAQEQSLKQVQVFVDAGKRPIADLYAAQATLAAAKAALVEATRSAERAKLDIIGTLQLDPAAEYDFAAPALSAFGAAGAADETADALIAKALSRRVDLSAQGARVDAAEQSVRAASAARWPSVSLSGSYNTGASSASSLAFQDQLDQRRGGSLSVGISIPVWDRLTASTAAQQARVQVDNARIMLAQQKQAVALDVRRALLDRDAAAAQLEAASAQVEAAQKALDATSERYRVGAATLLEVTQARSAQVEAASALVNARYTLVLQSTLLGYYSGELEPRA